MPTLTEFCRVEVDVHPRPIGATGRGVRVDVPFDGTATSNHWDGEWPVSGVDFITIGDNGIQFLDVHARIGEGEHTIAYHGRGRGTARTGVAEAVTFETGHPDFAWLNAAVGVGFGELDGSHLVVTLYVTSAD